MLYQKVEKICALPAAMDLVDQTWYGFSCGNPKFKEKSTGYMDLVVQTQSLKKNQHWVFFSKTHDQQSFSPTIVLSQQSFSDQQSFSPTNNRSQEPQSFSGTNNRSQGKGFVVSMLSEISKIFLSRMFAGNGEGGVMRPQNATTHILSDNRSQVIF